jgi:glycosyltransferase involved in cell wall biosynthesis
MQNHDAPYLSVIIPAYNEAKRIGATLSAIHAYLTAQSFTWEIIVVLDGPQDNTGEVARAFADRGAIRCLDRGENRGKGFTVREGMLAARGEIRLFTDADNSTDISHFDQMLPLFCQRRGCGHLFAQPAGRAGGAAGCAAAFCQAVFGQFGQFSHSSDGRAGHLGHAVRL